MTFKIVKFIYTVDFNNAVVFEITLLTYNLCDG